MKNKTQTITAKKKIAMIAHDNMKQLLCDWSNRHKNILSQHKLVGTGTTAYILEKKTGLDVAKYISGPLGGDQQIGAGIASGEIDVMFFFWDPFEPLPHDPDVKALLRIAAVWNIPIACNPASADFIITSAHFNTDYDRHIPDYEDYIKQRTQP